MERICVYPGSFDPITTGHMDMIRRAAQLFDRVIVAVLRNPAKKGVFPVEERLDMIRACCRDLPQVSVDAFEGLTMTYAMQVGACAVIRGVRNAADFAAEQNLAQINRRLCTQVDTVLLLAEPEHCMVSSSAVRELASFGGSISGFVPEEIEARVWRRLIGRE